ncbi:MAG: hypothetical protein JSR33_11295, partial [Proteobacteria bacterium]|nr:hypothetical protein [Pseudomonadota bacterium]
MFAKQSLRTILAKQQTQIFEFCLGCLAYSFRILLIIYLTQRLSLPLTNSYTILAIYFGSGGILECIALNLINKFYDYLFAIFEGLFLNLLGVLLLIFASKQAIIVVYLALSLITLGNVLLVSGVFILSSKIAKQESRRMIFTKNYVFLNLGSIAGIVISGSVYSIFEMQAALGCTFFLLILTLLNFLILFLKEIKKRAKIALIRNIAIQLGIIITSLLLSSFYFLNITFQWAKIILWIGIVSFMIRQFQKIQAKILV